MVKYCQDKNVVFGSCLPTPTRFFDHLAPTHDYVEYGTALQITKAEAVGTEVVHTSDGDLPR
jgi:Lon protease-like protein